MRLRLPPTSPDVPHQLLVPSLPFAPTAMSTMSSMRRLTQLDIFASMVVERDSQKGIMIGHQGEHLRDVGSRARAQISALLGTPVRLDLKVKVMKDWQRDPKFLNRLGF